MRKKAARIKTQINQPIESKHTIDDDASLEAFLMENGIDDVDIPGLQNSSFKPEDGYMQWSVGSNGKYIPCFKTTKKVPPGMYELNYSQELGFYIQKQSHFSDDLLELPIEEINEI
jgi:hypothetical protein